MADSAASSRRSSVVSDYADQITSNLITSAVVSLAQGARCTCGGFGQRVCRLCVAGPTYCSLRCQANDWYINGHSRACRADAPVGTPSTLPVAAQKVPQEGSEQQPSPVSGVVDPATAKPHAHRQSIASDTADQVVGSALAQVDSLASTPTPAATAVAASPAKLPAEPAEPSSATNSPSPSTESQPLVSTTPPRTPEVMRPGPVRRLSQESLVMESAAPAVRGRRVSIAKPSPLRRASYEDLGDACPPSFAEEEKKEHEDHHTRTPIRHPPHVRDSAGHISPADRAAQADAVHSRYGGSPDWTTHDEQLLAAGGSGFVPKPPTHSVTAGGKPVRPNPRVGASPANASRIQSGISPALQRQALAMELDAEAREAEAKKLVARLRRDAKRREAKKRKAALEQIEELRGHFDEMDKLREQRIRDEEIKKQEAKDRRRAEAQAKAEERRARLDSMKRKNAKGKARGAGKAGGARGPATSAGAVRPPPTGPPIRGRSPRVEQQYQQQVLMPELEERKQKMKALQREFAPEEGGAGGPPLLSPKALASKPVVAAVPMDRRAKQKQYSRIVGEVFKPGAAPAAPAPDSAEARLAEMRKQALNAKSRSDAVHDRHAAIDVEMTPRSDSD